MTDPTLTPRPLEIEPATPVADKDAVAALAEIIEQQAGWTWYGQHGQHAESILGILKEQGWRLSRVDETPPDALREALDRLARFTDRYLWDTPSEEETRAEITRARNLLNATPPASSLDEPK